MFQRIIALLAKINHLKLEVIVADGEEIYLRFSSFRMVLCCLFIAVMFVVGLFPNISAETFHPVKLKDQFHREVIISKAPKRIVSGAPGNTEILFALGLGPQIVGVTSWCDFPKAAKVLPKIGDISPLNVEKVLALHPDLVVAEVLNGKDAVNRLAEFGIPVLTLNANSFADILESVTLIGQATGTSTAAAILKNRLNNTLTKVRRQGAQIKPRGLKVYVVLGWEANWTAGPGSFLDEAVTLSGAENIARDLNVPWGRLSTELVLKRNPDVIITDIHPDKFYADPVFRKIAAIRKHQVYKIASDIYYRPGPRLILALENLANILTHCK